AEVHQKLCCWLACQLNKKNGTTASPDVMSFYGIRHFMIVRELTMPYQNTAGSDVVIIFASRAFLEGIDW
ncbi:hypothetical protein Q0S50_13465, partial [Escherichia coli :H19]